MAVKPQIKANQLAKDFNIKSKEIVDIMSRKGIELKTQKVLEPEEFEILFNAITQENQIEGIDDYIDGITYIPSKLEPKAKAVKEEENVEVKAQADESSQKSEKSEKAAKPEGNQKPEKSEKKLAITS